MQNNFSSGLSMQIPQENVFTGLDFCENFDYEFERIAKNYNLHRRQEVKEFIGQHDELLQYLDSVTQIINHYFPNYLKCLTFCDDFEFEELNDITIYINSSESSFERDCQKFNELEVKLITMDGFSAKIKKLVSVDLWLI